MGLFLRLLLLCNLLFFSSVVSKASGLSHFKNNGNFRINVSSVNFVILDWWRDFFVLRPINVEYMYWFYRWKKYRNALSLNYVLKFGIETSGMLSWYGGENVGEVIEECHRFFSPCKFFLSTCNRFRVNDSLFFDLTFGIGYSLILCFGGKPLGCFNHVFLDLISEMILYVRKGVSIRFGFFCGRILAVFYKKLGKIEGTTSMQGSFRVRISYDF